MKTIVLWNAKGGVGKTTLACSLAWSLARTRGRVLLLDGDPQGSAAKALGYPDPDHAFLGRSSAALLLSGDARVRDLAVLTKHGFDLLPGNSDLAAVDLHLAMETQTAAASLGVAELGQMTALLERLGGPEGGVAAGRERILGQMRRLVVRMTEASPASMASRSDLLLRVRRALARTKGYDWVIIDALPSLGLLSVNLLAASDYVIVPVEPESASLRALQNTSQAIHRLQGGLRPDLRLLAIAVNKLDQRVGHHRDVEAYIRRAYGEVVVTPSIRKSARIAEADAAGVPALAYAERDARVADLRSAIGEVVRRVSE